jgi:hypothetical protein
LENGSTATGHAHQKRWATAKQDLTPFHKGCGRWQSVETRFNPSRILLHKAQGLLLRNAQRATDHDTPLDRVDAHSQALGPTTAGKAGFNIATRWQA